MRWLIGLLAVKAGASSTPTQGPYVAEATWLDKAATPLEHCLNPRLAAPPVYAAIAWSIW
ncbi:hypothetical protein BO86DRAFT_392099 [Aspergillus japonicus CBS 114.51]|uniref:Uncharacterized protein n=1 Tax=Aspergillus japonicus CBS 114.51 TaxID=1448312 RepID=A0A8T8WQH1_ASPJA|nr:hypothetical protein BO86DRAFT_392099 [Aspergillus japonicus CBS 114.51]RAH78021.1 hypothetical protein BO86DRAFT_392099 [Aspergillus japonicus CBS 114.51]